MSPSRNDCLFNTYLSLIRNGFKLVDDLPMRAIKLIFSVFFFTVITACSNSEDEASKALLSLSDQYETASLWKYGSPRPGLLNEDDVDVALNAIREIRAELDAVIATFPGTTSVRDLLSNRDPYSDGLSTQKIDAQVKYLQSEKLLFQHRSKVLSEQGNKRDSRAFGFSFFEQSDTTCQKNSIEMFGVRDFIPQIQKGELSHFFIKFDDIIDLLMSVEEATNDAFTALDTHKRDELGIELWDRQDNKSQLIYRNMLRLFVNGYIPDYLENPEGVKVIPAMIELRDLSYKSMVRCSSQDNEDEFITRVGSWLPRGSTYYLDAIGSETDQFPVYVMLYSYVGKSDRTELTEPIVAGLNKKYGNAIARDWSIELLQQSWITNEGFLIILRFEGDRDPLSYAARFSLTYIYLPTFIKRYREFLEAYLVSYKHVVDSMRENTEQKNDQQASEINTKL